MKKILVTGATGFIGNPLILNLLEDGGFVLVCLLANSSFYFWSMARKITDGR